MGAHVLLWQTDIRQDIIKIKGGGNDKQQASGNVQANNSFISLILFRVSNPLCVGITSLVDSISAFHRVALNIWKVLSAWCPWCLFGSVDTFQDIWSTHSTSTWYFIMYRKNLGQQLLFYHRPAWSLCDQNRSRFDKKYRKTISGTKFTRALDAAWEKITSVHSDVACMHHALQKQTCMIQLFAFIRKIPSPRLKLLE